MNRRWKLVPCVLLTSVALVVPTQGSVSGAAASRPQTPPLAHAGAKAGKWIQLSSSRGISIIYQPNVLRLPTGGVQVVWPQDDGTNSQSIRTRIVKESGHIGSPISTVVKGWSSVVDDPRIIRHGAKRLVAFGGLRSTDVGETLAGEMAYATSGNGRTWKLGPGSLTQTSSAYASYGTAAVDDGGTPIVGVNASSSPLVTLHRGIDSSRPASAPDWTSKTGSYVCCAYYTGMAQNPKNHQVWAVWSSNSGKPKQTGVLAEKVYPKPVGKVLKAPGSTVGVNFLDPGQDMAVAPSTQGGAYAAYKVGYPVAKRIRIWEVGSRHTLDIPVNGANNITLQTGPQGRLWIAWYSTAQNRIKVARTDPSVKHVGAIRSIKPPGGGSAIVWKTAGSGASGPFHLIVNAQSSTTKTPQIWYQKVAPGLTLVAKPHQLDKGVVVAKVSDAGKAVAHAKVTFRGQSKQTNGRGIAKFRVPGSAHPGRYAMTAARAGYFPGHASVRVT